ncbi:MAG: Na-translocating system protein MpsC family protein [Solirubrobacteraceae bacterium]
MCQAVARALWPGPDQGQDLCLGRHHRCCNARAGFTPLEKTMMDSGQPKRVVAMREEFQQMMAIRYTEAIEELTGRRVQAFLSQAHVDPDITLEVFFVDRPLEGFGAFELTDGEKSEPT